MASRSRHVDVDRVVLDLNTQCDFLLARGAVPVVNRTDVVPHIRRLMDWARIRRVPVVSSLDAHRPGEPSNGTPRHCVDDTFGQQKLPFTLLPRRLFLQNDNTLDVPPDLLTRYRQVILAKRSRDFLSNPKADRLISDLPARYFIVFGVATEVCVKSVVLGLIARQRNAVIVTDALGHWNSAEAELAVRQMAAKGAVTATADEIIAGRNFHFAQPETSDDLNIPIWELPAVAAGNRAANIG